jgi:hypothetical protein
VGLQLSAIGGTLFEQAFESLQAPRRVFEPWG